MGARRVIFDVNETLLDVSALDPYFEELFGRAETRIEWFFSLEESFLSLTIVDTYRPFGVLAKGALSMVARRRGMETDPAQGDELVSRMQALPPHPDVVQALETLRRQGVAWLRSAMAPARRCSASSRPRA